MQAQSLAIAGLFVFEPKVFADDRGAFFESFNAQRFADATGLEVDFVQDNHSISRNGVVRVVDPRFCWCIVLHGVEQEIMGSFCREAPRQEGRSVER